MEKGSIETQQEKHMLMKEAMDLGQNGKQGWENRGVCFGRWRNGTNVVKEKLYTYSIIILRKTN